MKEFLIFLPATILYLALKSALIPSFPLPDLPLLLVFFMAYRKASMEGALLGFVLGYLEDVFTGGVVGSSSFALVCVFIATHFLAKKVEFSTGAIRGAGAGLFVVFKGVLMYYVLRAAGLAMGFPGRLFVDALVTAIFAPVIFTMLLRVTARVNPHKFRDGAR